MKKEFCDKITMEKPIRKKLMIILILGLIIVVSSLYLINYEDKIIYDEHNQDYEYNNDSERVYQGAVPLGYDLETFRETGETVGLEDISTSDEQWIYKRERAGFMMKCDDEGMCVCAEEECKYPSIT